jgi:hypothetical protein
VTAVIDGYIAHREAREAELLGALGRGTATIPDLVATMYRDVDRQLWPAAARQVLAYLIALEREGRVRAEMLDTPLTTEQRALLDPDLSRLGDDARAIARDEFGYGDAAPQLVAYTLTP